MNKEYHKLITTLKPGITISDTVWVAYLKIVKDMVCPMFTWWQAASNKKDILNDNIVYILYDLHGWENIVLEYGRLY